MIVGVEVASMMKSVSAVTLNVASLAVNSAEEVFAESVTFSPSMAMLSNSTSSSFWVRVAEVPDLLNAP